MTISKTGPVWYDWQAVRVILNKADTHEQWLLIRRSVHEETSDLDFFVSNAPRDTPLADLVMVASMRHEIEQVFEEAEDQLGLADYEVRTEHGWHRHMTLCFLAHTWLMTLSHAEREKRGPPTLVELQPRRVALSVQYPCAATRTHRCFSITLVLVVTYATSAGGGFTSTNRCSAAARFCVTTLSGIVALQCHI